MGAQSSIIFLLKVPISQLSAFSKPKWESTHLTILEKIASWSQTKIVKDEAESQAKIKFPEIIKLFMKTKI